MPQSLIRQSRPFEVEFAKLRCGPAFGENLATKATHCRAVFCLWRSRDHWGCLLLSCTTPFQPYPSRLDLSAPLQYKSLHQYITWPFSQHVDHRIPVQLASNFLILRASGFDFRYLVGLNFALACLMTVLLLYIAQRYRGYQMFGDVIIPLTTLSFSGRLYNLGLSVSVSFINILLNAIYLLLRSIRESRAPSLSAGCCRQPPSLQSLWHEWVSGVVVCHGGNDGMAPPLPRVEGACKANPGHIFAPGA